MIRSAYRATLFALYQFSILVGILLMPLALATRRFGINIPAHRVVDSLGSAYERRAETGA